MASVLETIRVGFWHPYNPDLLEMENTRGETFFADSTAGAPLSEGRKVSVVGEPKKDSIPTTQSVSSQSSKAFSGVASTSKSVEEDVLDVSSPEKPDETADVSLRFKVLKLEADGLGALLKLEPFQGRGTESDREVVKNLRVQFDKARNAAQPSSAQVATLDTLIQAINRMHDVLDKKFAENIHALTTKLNQILEPQDGKIYTLQTPELLVKPQGGIRGGFRWVFKDVARRTDEARTALVIKVGELVHENIFRRTPLESELVMKAEKVDALLKKHIEQSKK